MTIYYWAGIANFERNAFSEAEAVIDALLRGHYQAAGLERLKGKNLYSARINDADRLLFTSIKVEGKSYLLLLDIVHNHDYEKSRFLKAGVLARFLRQEGETIAAGRINADSYEAISALPVALQSEEQGVYQAAEYYNRDFIVLNADQRAAIEQNTYPLIISGSPGSGKSCIALLKLQIMVQDSDIKGKLLYLCKAPHLASHMQALWQQLPEAYNAKGELRTLIQFKSYETLLAELIHPSSAFVGLDNFSDWFKGYLSRRLLKGRADASPKGTYNPREVYLEFRNIAAAENLETYKRSGAKKTHFTDTKDQEFLFKAYETYIHQLNDASLIDPNFYIPSVIEPLFEHVLVDEAQDFPPAVLGFFRKLSQGNNITYCLDSRQDLFASRPSLPFLRELLHREEISPTIVQLSTSYRSPKAVIEFANRVLEIKRKLVGPGIDKFENPSLVVPEQEGGRLLWLDSLEHLEGFCAEFKKTEIVILVDEELLANPDWLECFEKQAPGYILLSAERIKGLEYPCVVLYQPLDGPAFQHANKILKASPQSPSELNNLLVPAFNALMVKATRVRGNQGMLIVCQKLTHQNQLLMEALQYTKALEAGSSSPPNPAITTSDDWTSELIRLEATGNHWTADRLRKQNVETATGLSSNQENDHNKRSTNHHSLVPKKFNPSPGYLPPRPAQEFIHALETKEGISAMLHEPHFLQRYEWQQVFHKADLLQRLAKSIGFVVIWASIQQKIAYKNLTSTALFQEPEKNQGSAFYWLSSSKVGRKFLVSLFQIHDSFLAKISAEQLTCKPDCDGAIASPLYWFCSNKEFYPILSGLLHNRDLAKKISPEHLSQVPSVKSGEHVNTSALYWLSASPEGQDLFEILLKANPSLYKTLTAESIERVRSVEAGVEENLSALYWLGSTPKGRSLLKGFFRVRGGLIKNLSAASLEREVTNLPGCLPQTSVFYWLSMHDDGVSLLETLFNANLELVKNLSDNGLSRTPGNTKGAFINSSVLYYLAMCGRGVAILKMLFENNPRLVSALSTESLERVRSAEAGPQANMSVLYLLALSANGIGLLKLLFSSNPALMANLSVECLERPLTRAAGDDANNSVLYLLAMESEGIELLKMLFEAKPELAANLNVESLERARVPNAAGDASTSVLYWLASREEGLSVLKLIFEANPRLVAALSVESLERPLPKSAGRDANTSALYWLAAQKEGISLLKYIFAVNPRLVENLSIEALERQRPPIKGVCASSSVVFFLVSSDEGVNLLKIIFNANPGLALNSKYQSLLKSSDPQLGSNTSTLFYTPRTQIQNKPEDSVRLVRE